MIKSKGRSIGRVIRRATGIPLPIAMRIGRMIAQDRYVGDIEARFPEVLSSTVYTCGDKCCSYPKFLLKGPKGVIQTEYELTETRIRDYVKA